MMNNDAVPVPSNVSSPLCYALPAPPPPPFHPQCRVICFEGLVARYARHVLRGETAQAHQIAADVSRALEVELAIK